MVDIEHAEYPMLPFFLKKGKLQKADVTVCQVTDIFQRFYLLTAVKLKKWAKKARNRSKTSETVYARSNPIFSHFFESYGTFTDLFSDEY